MDPGDLLMTIAVTVATDLITFAITTAIEWYVKSHHSDK